jgi:hypothetical protein
MKLHRRRWIALVFDCHNHPVFRFGQYLETSGQRIGLRVERMVAPSDKFSGESIEYPLRRA